MEVSAEKTEYTAFGARETNLLRLNVGETALKEAHTPKLLGLTMQPRKGLSAHGLRMKAEANTRLLQPRQVASPERGPDREQLRAFYLALVQNKMCYGVASWCFDTSLSDREHVERVQAQAAHIAAGIPKGANREYALREVRAAVAADRRGGTQESVRILPHIKGQRLDARESGGQHLPARAPNPRKACEGAQLVQHHRQSRKNTRREGVAKRQACLLQHHHAGWPQGGCTREGQEGAHYAACAAVQ
ncbi:hypothetical protein TRVL_09385 [Trypanosoma vivax]|nr:hypothetical protein TRVL_09385 [Trypanosoma vivax]